MNEFPIREVAVEVPKWLALLDHDHWLKQTLDQSLKESLIKIKKLKDVNQIVDSINDYDFVSKAYIRGVDTANASTQLKIEERDGL